ncbi:MAG: glycosyltransferase family 39 protein [Bacteroidales bacterium]|nr:glycosyltransferase family 39 protein [Bacteroidales bacterium]
MIRKLIDRHPILAVILLMLLTLSPIMALRDYTPSNELRYVSIVDEALEQGNVFAFTNQGQDYADKPPFYFWLMMLGRLIFGGHCMYYLSLLSFIPACIIIAVMDKWLRTAYPDVFSSRQRAGVALMLATTGLFLGMTVFLRMDMMMCMWIVLALWTFWKWDNGIGRDSAHKLLLPFYTFMALFTKGPVGILVPPVAIIVILGAGRRWKETGKYLGLVFWGMLAVLCAIWFTGAFLDGGSSYLNNLLFHQTVDRAVNSFHHKAPVWFYLGLIWAVMAPWCLATVPALISGLLKKHGSDLKPSGYEKTLALTGVSTFVMLSCFSSKLAIYLAPIFPFAVYLWPAVVYRKGWNGWHSAAVFFAALLAAIVGFAAAVASFACLLVPKLSEFVDFPFLKSPLILLGGMVLAYGGIKGLVTLSKYKGEWEKPVNAVSVSLLSALFLVSFLMPSINDYIGYGNLCKLVPDSGQVYTLKVHRPENMDVYLGRDVYNLGDDIDSFLLLAPREGTLILPVKAFGESEALGDYLEDLDLEYCGQYAVCHLDPLAQKPARKTRRSRK